MGKDYVLKHLDVDSCSFIKWQKGKPKENGKYLVTTNIETVLIAWRNGTSWLIGNMSLDIEYKAWFKLSDIEPYKEKKK